MVKMEMTVENAYQRSIKTLLEWIHTEVNASKTQVYFRTYAPVHFRFVLITTSSSTLFLVMLSDYNSALDIFVLIHSFSITTVDPLSFELFLLNIYTLVRPYVYILVSCPHILLFKDLMMFTCRCLCHVCVHTS